MRLIDADDLQKELKERIFTEEAPSVVLTPTGQEIFNSGIESAIFAVSEAETIDAVPVVNAGWIMNHFGAKCSNCLRLYCVEPSWSEKIKHMPPTWIYCPNCGAKMDKEETGE